MESAPEPLAYAFAATSLGELAVVASELGVCAVLLGERRVPLSAELARRFPRAELHLAQRRLAPLLAGLVELVERPLGALAPPLDLRGTPFQRRVWDALRTIPPGTTWSYQRLAEAIDRPSATRAVAGACAANPAAVVVPCHRVVGARGGLGGYSGGDGIETKRALLRLEGTIPAPGVTVAAADSMAWEERR